MHSLLAISTDGLFSPKFAITSKVNNGLQLSPEWGLGSYPKDQVTSLVYKQAASSSSNPKKTNTIDWSSFRSSTFLFKIEDFEHNHVKHDIQPFAKAFAGSEWLFAHSGKLDKVALEKLSEQESRLLEPLGRTDSELAFCYLLGKLRETTARSLRDLAPNISLQWISSLDHLGSADIILSDGATLLIYHGQNSKEELYYTRSTPPHTETEIKSEEFSLHFTDPRDAYRSRVLISSEPLSSFEWTKMLPGQLLIVRAGAIVWKSQSEEEYPSQAEEIKSTKEEFKNMLFEEPQVKPIITNPRAITRTAEGAKLSYRMFEISHVTEYSYSEPIEHSTHLFRLQPRESSLQEVEYSAISISIPGESIQFEDVFGNHTLHYTISENYSQLRIENQSRIKVYSRPRDDISHAKRQTNIPLIWMPWQRQMMMPYLLPHELPDTQLEELTSYAMSFVERNDYNLLETLKDINATIYRDYSYRQGETTLETTPFEVYTKRVGVCQDFSNILICLAQLLGVPARYQMGYIYTGSSYENKLQSEGSHAWVELYLPYIGWRGYDPTNGCLVNQDHISVARGRNYRDATPTSGTIFKGGGKESLSINVKVLEV